MTCSMPLCSRTTMPGKETCGTCWSDRRDLERAGTLCEYCRREQAVLKTIIPAMPGRRQRILGFRCAYRLERARQRARRLHLGAPFEAIEHSYETEPGEVRRPRRVRSRPRFVSPWREAS